jgi:uncharacterized protein YbjT (DUF2867 family)
LKALVAGGTGLVGQFLLEELEQDPKISSITALTRSSQDDTPKISWKVVDFDSQSELQAAFEDIDLVFCCLGTTIKKAGSKEAFYKVDHDYVLALAKSVRKNDVGHFSVVSAVGADSKSKVFYSRVKGEMEADLRELSLDRLHIFQPSILLGPRKESRVGEKVGAFFMKILSPLMLGGMKKYRPVQVRDVAKAMVRKAKEVEKGVRVFQYPSF